MKSRSSSPQTGTPVPGTDAFLTPRGGVYASSSSAYARAPKIELLITESQTVGMIEFSVVDNGIGIASEDQAKLFAPFCQFAINSHDGTNTRTAPGFGLGLSICLELVRLMGGELQISSVYGSGTTVTFTLPSGILDGSMSTRSQAQPAANLDITARLSRLPNNPLSIPPPTSATHPSQSARPSGLTPRNGAGFLSLGSHRRASAAFAETTPKASGGILKNAITGSPLLIHPIHSVIFLRVASDPLPPSESTSSNVKLTVSKSYEGTDAAGGPDNGDEAKSQQPAAKPPISTVAQSAQPVPPTRENRSSSPGTTVMAPTPHGIDHVLPSPAASVKSWVRTPSSRGGTSTATTTGCAMSSFGTHSCRATEVGSTFPECEDLDSVRRCAETVYSDNVSQISDQATQASPASITHRVASFRTTEPFGTPSLSYGQQQQLSFERSTSLCIYIVDDNTVNVTILHKILSLTLNCQIHTFDNAKDTLEAILNDEFLIDESRAVLLLTDVHMPLMNGIELTQSLRQRFSSTKLPIVGVTADRTTQVRSLCLEAGMQAVLTKPVLRGHLVDTLANVLMPVWGDVLQKYFL